MVPLLGRVRLIEHVPERVAKADLGLVVEAVLGQQVPGLGRIEEIRNENGRLVVESSGGVIYSSRKATP